MRVKTVLLISAMLFSILLSENDGTLVSTPTGEVAFIASWAGTGDSDIADVSSAFANMDIATYDVSDDGLGAGSDFIAFDNIIDVNDFDANYAFNITATKGTWTLPANYNETALTSKRTDGSDENFYIKVVIDDQGTGNTPVAGGAAVQNSYDSYQPVKTAGEVIISGGSTATNDSHGVENAQFHIDSRVSMDWVYDIKGVYSINVTLTVSSQ